MSKTEEDADTIRFQRPDCERAHPFNRGTIAAIKTSARHLEAREGRDAFANAPGRAERKQLAVACSLANYNGRKHESRSWLQPTPTVHC